MDDMPPEQI